MMKGTHAKPTPTRNLHRAAARLHIARRVDKDRHLGVGGYNVIPSDVLKASCLPLYGTGRFLSPSSYRARALREISPTLCMLAVALEAAPRVVPYVRDHILVTAVDDIAVHLAYHHLYCFHWCGFNNRCWAMNKVSTYC
ncbi:hypothetical protein SETIT_4G144500v2 [Setaria italica]|uniref:Uncharacterized protein n=1 Tax=Setaria italica TaxID=4555 RepID=A0A368QU65_SETIT|nr:hypothetical protein SETIT_4G144500v2 [Setaria italica]